ncbi:MAG TPA: biopolymer transporter ExbD [Gemmataceae bacterium]|nr:biopolymer transporter ExbD [Gemmataceae bacterium]
MAEKRRLLDVWILETKTVYREVPYAVVTDWVQQGRLLESDMVRVSGSEKWVPLVSLPDFAVYLPRPEPFRAEDRAEALEPVEVDFSWKRPAPDEEGDPDMIPLIDVSLVLLLFFMMTASVAAVAAQVNTPEARFGAQLASDPRMVSINITLAADGTPLYALSQGDQAPSKDRRETDLNEGEVLQLLDERMKEEPDRVDVSIKADRNLPFEVVKKLMVALETRFGRRVIRKAYAGVSEKENQ